MKLTDEQCAIVERLERGYEGHVRNRTFFKEGGIYQTEEGEKVSFFVCLQAFPEPRVMQDAEGVNRICYAVLRDSNHEVVYSHQLKRIRRVVKELTDVMDREE